jgi:hypothetical protein
VAGSNPIMLAMSPRQAASMRVRTDIGDYETRERSRRSSAKSICFVTAERGQETLDRRRRGPPFRSRPGSPSWKENLCAVPPSPQSSSLRAHPCIHRILQPERQVVHLNPNPRFTSATSKVGLSANCDSRPALRKMSVAASRKRLRPSTPARSSLDE